MKITKLKLLLVLILIGQTVISYGQKIAGITIPDYKDKYCEFVKQLESGNTDIDYNEFRNSFLDSKQFNIKEKNKSKYDSLKREVYAQIKKANYDEVIKLTQAMLSIDYTSLFAHKYLQQTYKITGDTANRNKYHDIEFGLLYSIINSGDGKSCKTSWQVIQIEEEYFILNMLEADLKMQSIDNSENNICDKMEVMEDGKNKIYYFGVKKVFSKYPKSKD
jgi:hypothetical protein